MVILSLTEKGGETKQLQFDKAEVGIGRVQGNDIVLPKGNVSKRHCRIVLQDGRFQVEDLKSTNGTYINGRKLTEATEVFGGDKIYIGDFVVRIENAPTAEAAGLGNEAGSLSTALGNRRPPPPPARATGAMPIAEDGGRDSGRGGPPPPPPPGRRDTMLPSNAEAPAFASTAPPPPPAPAPSAATVLDLDDDEPLATAPPRAPTPPPRPPTPPPLVAAPPPVPPPVPPAPPVPPVFGNEAPEGDDDLRERALSDAVTATKKRGAVAPNKFDNPANPAAWIGQLLGDASVGGIYILGPEAVEIERNGKREAVSLGQAEAKALSLTLKNLAERAGVSIDSGVVDVAVEGARMVAIFPPYARSVCASVTRGIIAEGDLSAMVQAGVMSNEVKSLLHAAMETRCNILVAGDRPPALALLRALAKDLDGKSSVVSVGELVSSTDPETPWVTLATEPRNPDLVHAAAHLRADYMFADVTAAAMAADILHECAFGQQGAVVLASGRSTRDALARLEAATGGSFRSASVGKLLATAFDLVVHVTALPGGGARILAVAEPTAASDGRIDANELLVFEAKGDGGSYKSSGVSSRLAKTLESRGKGLPNEVLRR